MNNVNIYLNYHGKTIKKNKVDKKRRNTDENLSH